MVIKLYYIEGISRIDTPYYAKQGQQATLAAQEAFFDEHVVTEIDTAFYPPHYTNEVKLTTDDVDFNTNVNYLSLEFNDKTYYYFIDDIEYISENMIKLYITMDTIQTYMFDIYIASGIVTRKFINRWTDNNEINRNYLRENVSKDEFVPVDFTIVNGDTSKWVAVAKKTEQVTNKDISGITNYYLDDNQTQILAMSNIPSSFTYGFAILKPMTNSNATRSYIASSGSYGTLAAGEAKLNQGAYNVSIRKSWCVDMYLCPFDCIMGFVFNGDDTVGIDNNRIVVERLNVDSFVQQTITDWLVSDKLVPTPVIGANLNVYEYSISWKKHATTLNFTKNTNPLADFDASYVPALIDNNYIRYTFGSYYANTTYPLYTLKTPTLYSWYTFILDSGARVYLINEHSDRVDDVYRVAITDTNILNLALKNDAWESYVSQNRSRWVGAIASTALDIISMGGSKAAKIGVVGAETIRSNQFKILRRKNKDGSMSKGRIVRTGSSVTSRKVFGEIPGSEEDNSRDIALSISRGVGGQLLADLNTYVAPTAMKSSANTDGMIDKAAWIFAEVEYVRDFSQCANYYHRNSYRVDEYVNDIDNIFDYVQNRVYYNFLEMVNPEVHLHNVIEDENTIDAIKERLEAGVRLWRFDGGVTVSTTERTTARFATAMRVDTTTFNLSEDWTDVTSIEVQLARPTQGQTLNVTLVGTPQVAKVGNRFVVTISYLNPGDDIDWTVISTVTGRKTLNNHIGNYTYDNVELDYLQ